MLTDQVIAFVQLIASKTAAKVNWPFLCLCSKFTEPVLSTSPVAIYLHFESASQFMEMAWLELK